ncbi:hypothetical protein [Streptomyces sp. NPDC054842]
MPELPSFTDAAIDAVLRQAGGSTLPFGQAHRSGSHATAFWFNELVASGPDGEVIRQYLVTAGELTRFGLAEVTLRPALGIPAPSADKLALPDFEQGWIHLDGLGVAVLPTEGLHAYAKRKGWRWNTDEITDGVAARAEDIARIGADPMPAYALCHDVGVDGERDQAIVVGALARADDGTVRWGGGALPPGCVGAPVFAGVPLETTGEGAAFKLVCAGVALPPDGHGFGSHPVATFDAVRAALGAVSTGTPPPPAPQDPRAAPKRRWWRRTR